MALDYAFLNVLAMQLDQRLRNARIEKIIMPSRDEVVFNLRTPQSDERLFLSARSGASRVHLTDEAFEAPATPANFCMLLRKYLGRGRIEAVRSVPGERLLFIDFTAVAETGDLMKLTLSVEMMGRYSNLVLVRGGVVVDALKRVSPDKSDVRQLLPQLPFELPPAQGKRALCGYPAGALAEAVLAAGGPLSAALLRTVSGISPVACREISYRVTAGADTDAECLSPAGRTALTEAIALVQRAAQGDGTTLCAVYDGEKAVDFSVIPLTQYAGCELRYYDDASALLVDYYGERDRQERQKNRSRDLIRQVSRLHDKAVHKHEARLRDQQSTAAAECKRLYGELLTANLHAVEKGARTASLLNYYTGETVDIPLDPRLSAGANAQKYYKEYRKLTTAQRMLETLLQQDEQEIAYLSSVAYAASCAETEAEFDVIRSELKGAGYLKNFKEKEPRRRGPKKESFLRYRTPSGFTVLCGRNNLQNEQLTFRTADRRDVWFHVKNYPGSHTVLLTDGREPTEAALREAGMVAVRNSAASASAAVDWTEIRNVKKQPGGRPGMVNYLNFRSAVADYDPQLVDGWREG